MWKSNFLKRNFLHVYDNTQKFKITFSRYNSNQNFNEENKFFLLVPKQKQKKVNVLTVIDSLSYTTPSITT